MADLLQIVHKAVTDSPDLPPEIEWSEQCRDVIPASNRRRILDREHAKGRKPQADGWLHMAYPIGDGVHVHQRIRWEDLRLVEAEVNRRA
ncbi:hypothetical protein BH787_gp23 [Gordonia phage GMA4]|uniref:hypothetical protein n=1 Tax=Gordonia phage GMA4 TaxID=1647471 RepID=UPI0006BE01EA|nr:hypothetical protein BH787_gp23 [Gordonia phage GMA4]AKJ72325.1 hypothetical protein GMA4_50 [Gordonia phage GMA4]